MLTDEQIIAAYGKPGDTDNLATISLPYPMRIAWDKSHSVTKMQCHKKLVGKFLSVFSDLKEAYGYDKLRELEIDVFGGCYNLRQMRGSKTKWSRHSWAIAIDLNPDKNGLKTSFEKSQFSNPEYKAMMYIFYKNGFINYGKELNKDSMHFEINVVS
jgi:hypothetical protein